MTNQFTSPYYFEVTTALEQLDRLPEPDFTAVDESYRNHERCLSDLCKAMRIPESILRGAPPPLSLASNYQWWFA